MDKQEPTIDDSLRAITDQLLSDMFDLTRLMNESNRRIQTNWRNDGDHGERHGR